jgi:hypothetical protein
MSSNWTKRNHLHHAQYFVPPDGATLPSGAEIANL